ncbi:hypothetical protein [Streptomyces rugosispiralis]|uniref:Transcriptional regulator n=1 Tax=Streptomyces rugosispiralis TaxID=2967341 RepID=A0ABT1UW07_9ACTN|nr:hypothetical protein [Streptomyces rugosispiralis]MCQ8189308.1 hypothetical protein [Streptomyces rugosispiralis]
MTDYVSPAALPPHVLEREDMRAALACHDFGTVFTLARKWGGISFTKIADACGMKTDRVGVITKGNGRITTIDKIIAVADGLRIPGALLGLAPRPWESHTPASGAVRPMARIGMDRGDDHVLRRNFMSLSGAALLAAATTPSAGASNAPQHTGLAAPLLRHLSAFSVGEPQPRTPAELRTAVTWAKRAYQACEYTALANDLPRVLTECETACEVLTGDDRLAAHACLAELYHTTTSLLLKLGDRGPAAITADRSMHAAQTSEDPLTQAASARILVHAYMAMGHGNQAADIARTRAQRLDPKSITHSPDHQSIYGALLLRGAVAAAEQGDRDSATELLDEAERAARMLGSDANRQWTAFGPTNVLLHRVNISTTLGDAGAALAYARAIDIDTIDVRERQATLWVDVARACEQWNKYPQAYAALRTAEDLAPEEIRTRPTVKALVGRIHHQDVRGELRGLPEMAARVGAHP